jgi:hypothetical protein
MIGASYTTAFPRTAPSGMTAHLEEINDHLANATITPPPTATATSNDVAREHRRDHLDETYSQQAINTAASPG